ncbi:MAG TPA: hydrogen peroxide-inducible genes activator [Gammaproteobacteria bacterium]|nr:hydrogen peroxide-inducible genes activator [Gammaproteobacteria bacterium]
MTLTELRYIVTLGQEKHFGRAAERCHVSQPTLSIAVKKLEQELGVALFERSMAGIQPTPLGEQVILKARRLLEQATEIKDVVNAGKDPLAGPLSMGTLPTIGPYLLPQFIPLLQKLAENMPLYIEEGSVDQLRKKLRSGELDVIITTLPFTESDVVTQRLFEEPFVVLLPASHALSRKTALTASDLHPREVLLLAEGHCFREQILAALPHLQPGPAEAGRSLIQGSTLETLRHMVASGLGITILPLSAAETPFYSQDQLAIRPFVRPSPHRTLALSWRASFPRHKAIDVLRKTIEASSPAFWSYNTSRHEARAGILVENKDW